MRIGEKVVGMTTEIDELEKLVCILLFWVGILTIWTLSLTDKMLDHQNRET